LFPQYSHTSCLELFQAVRHRLVHLIAERLAPAPDALVLAEASAPALLACAPSALVLADARAPALPASAPDALVVAKARALHALHRFR